MVLTTVTAYALSFKQLVFRRQILLAVIFTMLFNPGMIANYITFRAYHLMNSYWALLLPRAINVFYLLLLKNFFQEISNELKEAATIDGCGPLGVFLRIVLPLSLPSLATFTLFYAVDNWNAFFDALLYISSPQKWPITIIMRQVVLMASSAGGSESALELTMSLTSMRMATVTVAIVPILGSYPFLQRYFQSGLMAGSIKG
jgi:putative aldouronate transport system permease protein